MLRGPYRLRRRRLVWVPGLDFRAGLYGGRTLSGSPALDAADLATGSWWFRAGWAIGTVLQYVEWQWFAHVTVRRHRRSKRPRLYIVR